jgi:hypothetical protein
MLSAMIHEYQSPLVLEQTPKPKIIHGEQVLVKLGLLDCVTATFIWLMEIGRKTSIFNYQKYLDMKLLVG